MTSITSSMHSAYVREHNKHVIQPPKFTSRAIKKYVGTRISSLFPSKEEFCSYSKRELFNPFYPLKQMSWRNWNYFLMGFAGWTWDSFDFFAVSLNVHDIAETFDKSVTDVTWGITLVLMLRSVGAVIFGFWGDRYGRKWPYIINLGLLVVLQIGTGFVQTYQQFLGVRALFGIAMGGVFGFSLATSLDDVPVDCRGVLSGIFQEGYAFGYLLTVIFNRAIVPNNPHGWRAIFWFAAGPPRVTINRALLHHREATINNSSRCMFNNNLKAVEVDAALHAVAVLRPSSAAAVLRSAWLVSLNDNASKTLHTFYANRLRFVFDLLYYVDMLYVDSCMLHLA